MTSTHLASSVRGWNSSTPGTPMSPVRASARSASRRAITPHSLASLTLGTASSFRMEKEDAVLKSEMDQMGSSSVGRLTGTQSSPNGPPPAEEADTVPLRTHSVSTFPAFNIQSIFSAATHEAERHPDEIEISAEKHAELVDIFVGDMLRDKKDPEVEDNFPFTLDPESKETEHIASLIMSLTSDNKQRVSDSARELMNMLEEAEEHVAIKLRMKILSVPLALEKICFSITAAEEHWMVLVPTGLSIRSGPHTRKPRIGNLDFGEVVPVVSVHAAWLRIADKFAPKGFAEAWVALFDEPTGRACMQRATEDEHKVSVVGLVLLLCESRHLSLQLCSLTGLLPALSFLATITPRSSPIKAAAQSLLFRLRSSSRLLHGGSLPSRPARDPALLTSSRSFSALDVHALRTETRRRPASPLLATEDARGHRARLATAEEGGRERSRVSVGREETGESVGSRRGSASLSAISGRASRAGGAAGSRQSHSARAGVWEGGAEKDVVGRGRMPAHMEPVQVEYGSGVHSILEPPPAHSLRAGAPAFTLHPPSDPRAKLRLPALVANASVSTFDFLA